MYKLFIIGLLSTLLITACKPETSTTDKDTKKDTVSTTDSLAKIEKPKSTELIDYQGKVVEINPVYNDFARYIAYLDVENPQYDSLKKYSFWQRDKKQADSIWQNLEEKRFSKMRTFAQSEISEFLSSPKQVLYPFSGPDFINAFTLYPNAQTITMMALEPVGSISNFSTKSKSFTEEYLYHLNMAVNDLYKKSYFITQHMGGHLQQHRANGTLPLLTMFIVRAGNKILNVRKVTVDSTGNYTLDSLKYTKESRPRAVRIDFVNEKNPTEVKSVFYFQADITDPGLNKKKGLIPFLKAQQNCVGYFKSASYCCFDPIFTQIKTTMLDKCDLIVQDDTGIPYRDYSPSKWNINLYGMYEKPVRDFGSYTYQKDLDKVYHDSTVVKKPMNFSLGYHWQTKVQNIMIFKKKK
ncbi:MAG: hypothetical protein U0V72_04055 [Cytophagales bacterium]